MLSGIRRVVWGSFVMPRTEGEAGSECSSMRTFVKVDDTRGRILLERPPPPSSLPKKVSSASTGGQIKADEQNSVLLYKVIQSKAL